VAKRLNILVIEDSERCARILEIALEERGHTVKIASTLDAASFALSAVNFDAIICDLLLPDGNGCEIMPNIVLGLWRWARRVVVDRVFAL
jgi:DNA-binding response OmpR family regulator